MEKNIAFFALFGMAAFPFFPFGGKDSFASISMREAREMIEAGGDFIVLDVRTPSEYAEGHIPGAILLPNEEIGAGGDTGPKALSLLRDKGQKILVYCRSGARSRQAAAKLSEAGYTNVVNIGGISSWDGGIER